MEINDSIVLLINIHSYAETMKFIHSVVEEP